MSPLHESNSDLLKNLLVLAIPVWLEQVLHMLVGLTDTYLANHLAKDIAPHAGAAVGTITYFLWFFGVLVNAIGAGSTAIISRARGARHRSLMNSVCGQSVSAAFLVGLIVGFLMLVFTNQIIRLTGLSGEAVEFARSYLRMLSIALPFTLVMFIASSCQRGAGDTLTPAIVLVIVDIINMVFSFGFTRGWFGLPKLGFDGIAIGTVIAYIAGGVIQFVVLLKGQGELRLHLHRLRPHWLTIKRLLRIGIPAGVEGFLSILANFGVVYQINRLDPTNLMSAAHMSTIRLESVSFLTGMAFAVAATTMVGQSLGMKNPARAVRSTWLAYACGGGAMALCGLIFITLGKYPAAWIGSDNPELIELTTQCLFITGFIQPGFAAYLIFAGALRGAGDTFVVMMLSLISVIVLRFLGVQIVGGYFNAGLTTIWIVLALELFTRGAIAFGRFLQGGWKKIEV